VARTYATAAGWSARLKVGARMGSESLVYAAGAGGLELRKRKPDGSLADPSPEETALVRALDVARASKDLRERFYLTHDQNGNPIVYERDLPDVLAKADRLWHPLAWLQQSLTDSAMRKRLADAHADAVSYAGEVAPSYVEAIFRAGERQYVTVEMLCLHGVLFDYISRLHPSQSDKLSEPWPKLPALEGIQFTGTIKGDGSGHNCTSAKQLLAKICREVTALPSVDSTVDCEQVRTFLEKEIAATRGSATVGVGNSLIERLLAGPNHAELTPTELALLEAHLQQPISMAAIQGEKKATGKSETNTKRNKLTLIRDYNRNLQSASNSPTPAKAKRPGRKKADYKTVQREAELAADWKRAYEAGTYKADFARDNKLTVSKLDALLDRVAKRKARSEN
jgi:hypothetical protein